MNPHEQAARTVKAYAIADFITVPVEVAEQASLDWWGQVARAIGVRAPSQDTVDQILLILRSRSEVARASSPNAHLRQPPASTGLHEPEGGPAASSLVSA